MRKENVQVDDSIFVDYDLTFTDGHAKCVDPGSRSLPWKVRLEDDDLISGIYKALREQIQVASELPLLVSSDGLSGAGVRGWQPGTDHDGCVQGLCARGGDADLSSGIVRHAVAALVMSGQGTAQLRRACNDAWGAKGGVGWHEALRGGEVAFNNVQKKAVSGERVRSIGPVTD